MKNQENSNQFNWGESVRVKITAPANFSPGEIASVCGMTQIRSEKLAHLYKSNIGEWVYTVEFIGGSDMEIPERYLEKHEDVE